MNLGGWLLLGISWTLILIACGYLLYKTLSTPRK